MSQGDDDRLRLTYGEDGERPWPPLSRPLHILLIDPRPFDRACTIAGLKESEHLAVDALNDLGSAHAGPAPDVVLLQEDMSGKPQHTLPEQLARVRRRWPAALSIVVSQEGDDDRLMDSLQVGVHGVLTSNAHPEAWISSIRLIASGETVYPRGVIELVRTIMNGTGQMRAGLKPEPVMDDRFQSLTPRQQEVLQLLATGLSNHKIANVLRISVSTVKVHVRAIMMQVGVENRTQIVAQYVGKPPI